MQVFVTGATGVLGQRIVDRLADSGHDVVGLVRDEAGESLVEQRGGEPRYGDVLDPKSLEDAVDDPDVVVHAATAIPTDTNPPDEAWERNDRVRLDGARNLVDAVDDVNRVLFPSVVWLARQPDGSEFDETAERYPTRATESAAEVEDFLLQRSDRGEFDASILRCGFFYAADSAHLREFGEQLLAGRLPALGRGLLGRRDPDLSWIHVDDAANAFVAAIENGTDGIYHVVDDEPTSAASFIDYLASLLDTSPPRRLPAWLGRFLIGAEATKLFTEAMPTTHEKLTTETGWEPTYETYREGLEAMVETWIDEGTVRETADGYEWVGE